MINSGSHAGIIRSGAEPGSRVSSQPLNQHPVEGSKLKLFYGFMKKMKKK